MGVSTDGQIWFGIDFEEGDETLARAMKNYLLENKIIEEEDDYFDDPDDINDPDEYFYSIPEDIRKGIELVTHCSGECRMYVICIEESSKYASRGYPEKINIVHETSEQGRLDWKARIIAFCKEIGIEIDSNDINWHLSSMWI